ncbi:MAG: type II secretion system GspH family protein [Gammaproteobacteria bacterium]|nr:type II secretion system GspH family protein [Gammaproteobacteria bacterium]
MNATTCRKERGFSLYELTFVLVIIGLITSAVTIGTNLQRTAEYLKIKQKFVDQWVQAYNQYYTRSGVVLGDEQTEPRFMVGGASLYYPLDGNQPGIPGFGIKGMPGKICHGQGYPPNSVGRGDRHLARARSVAGRTVDQDLFSLLDRHGIRMPPARAEGREDRYVYLDTNGNPQELQICFQWNPPRTTSGSGNMMVLRGLTPDLARMLDEQIDGRVDAREGMFRQQNINPNTLGSNGRAGHEWVGNNTYSKNGKPPTATGTGDNRDEDEVILVTAHYKMNQ